MLSFTSFVHLYVNLYSASQTYGRHLVMEMYQKQSVCRCEDLLLWSRKFYTMM